MLREERLQAMLRILSEQEFLTVEELSTRLMVSHPTIRRDLADLAQRRLIVRSHGGAMRAPDEKVTAPLDFRRSIHAREKSLISREAAKLIRSNTVIYLDASTTAAYIAEYLRPQQQVTVVTNGLMTAVRLQSKGIRTYCLGGEIVGSSLASGGPIALDSARNFNIDLMFFSSYGVNDRGDIVDTSESETMLRRCILRSTAASVFLCDSSKFGKQSIYNCVSLGDVDYFVTDAQPPEGYPTVRRETIIAT